MVAVVPSVERVTVRPLSVPADSTAPDGMAAISTDEITSEPSTSTSVVVMFSATDVSSRVCSADTAQVRRVGDGVNGDIEIEGAGGGRGLGAGLGVRVRGRGAHLQGEVVAAVGGRQDGETAGRKARQVGVGERPVCVGAGDGGAQSVGGKGDRQAAVGARRQHCARRDGGDLDRRDNLGAVDVHVGRGDVQRHRRVFQGLLGGNSSGPARRRPRPPSRSARRGRWWPWSGRRCRDRCPWPSSSPAG